MPSSSSLALFETAIGACAIVWSDRGIVGLQLPESSDVVTRERALERFGDADELTPPPEVKRAIRAVVRLTQGKGGDLRSITLDMEDVPPFHRRVYEVARTIDPGTTLSYGEVAALAGSPGAARAVGQALRRNPFAIIVPCHRVLAAGGKVGGFSANGGAATKARLLSIEGVSTNGPVPGTGADSGLGFDPIAAVRHVRSSDPAMARLIDAVGPLDIQVQSSPTTFGALAEAIVYQQLTGKAAAKIFGRVCSVFGGRRGLTARNVARVSEEELRSAGLSRSKVLSLQDLARRSLAGTVPTLGEARRMDDEEIIDRLSEVRGIGRWTAEMFLIFRLGRPDVLPVGDYGIRKGFAVAHRRRELPDPADVARRGNRWKPYRTAASWYLWRAVEQSPLAGSQLG